MITDGKVRLVAEIGMTHDGSFGLAKRLTEEAISSGADIIKYQWHIAEYETTKDAPSPPYFKDESRYDYFKRTEFSSSQFAELADLCRSKGREPCVSVFSSEALLRALKSGYEIIKVPSGELTNTELLVEISNRTNQVILSTGMSTLLEVDEAVKTLRGKVKGLVVLQCTSLYPTPPEAVGLNILELYRRRFSVAVGLSDHTLGIGTAIAAVVLGACVVEKHFTISRKMFGPDARFSLEPEEFRALRGQMDFITASLNNPVDKSDLTSLLEMRQVFQKFVVAKVELPIGTRICREHLALKKVGRGSPCREMTDMLGMVTSRSYRRDDPIFLEDLIS